MKSLRCDRSANSNKAALVLQWVFAAGFSFVVAIRCWVLDSHNKLSHLEPDPDPDHWTRSLPLTFLAGSAAGLVAGCCHAKFRPSHHKKSV